MKKTRKQCIKPLVLVTALAAALFLAAPASAETWPQMIERFECPDPVFVGKVPPGTPIEELGLPETLRAVLPLSQGLYPAGFVQAVPPAADERGGAFCSCERYCYFPPEDANERYDAEEPVIYMLVFAAASGGSRSPPNGTKSSPASPTRNALTPNAPMPSASG